MQESFKNETSLVSSLLLDILERINIDDEYISNIGKHAQIVMIINYELKTKLEEY